MVPYAMGNPISNMIPLLIPLVVTSIATELAMLSDVVVLMCRSELSANSIATELATEPAIISAQLCYRASYVPVDSIPTIMSQ